MNAMLEKAMKVLNAPSELVYYRANGRFWLMRSEIIKELNERQRERNLKGK